MDFNKGQGILKTIIPINIDTINPQRYDSITNAQIIRLCGSRLYAYLPNNDFSSYELKGQLAKGKPKKIDEEGKVWHIDIKENAKWANGDDISAYDVVYSLKQMFDPLLLSPKAGNLISGYITIKNAKQYYFQNRENRIMISWKDVGVKTINNKTIEIITEESYSDIDVMMHFSNAASTLVYDKVYENTFNSDRTKTSYGNSADYLMSSGPFILEEWIPGQILKFKKNPNYVYTDLIKLAGMEIRIVENEEEQIKLFENEEIDYLQLSARSFSKYERDPRVLIEPHKVITSLTFNTLNPDKPILNNVNFRNALYYSIDRENLSRLTKETPANYYISAARIVYCENGIRYRDTDVAKSIIPENLGYNPSLARQYFNCALKEEGLDSVELTLQYGDIEPTNIIAKYFSYNVPKILGENKISIKLQSMSYKEARAKLKTWKTNPIAYEIAFCGWGGSSIAPWNTFKYHTSMYINKNEPWTNQELDRIYKEASYGHDRYKKGKRLEYTARMEEIMFEEKPLVPISQKTINYLKNDRVELAFKEFIPIIGFGWEYSSIKNFL